MTYHEAFDYIEAIGQKGSILGLGPITELLLRLGNPQEQLHIIHVAGTNGKGSICTFLEMLYREEGKKVGRYISPTIHEYLERFQINGELMAEDVFARLITQVDEVIAGMREDGCAIPTAFEIETAVAFLYFAENDVDIVVLEVGMGGREDATNVISHPICTVFANIGMDHMQFLGDTLEKIAYEKAGIIKEGCPAVCYPGDDRTIEVLRKEYEKVNEIANDDCGFTVADTSKLEILSETLDGSTFIYKGEEYSISLAGNYQIYNAITAIETKLRLDGALIREGLSKVRWEGRFNKICDKPLFIKDGAHNVQGVMALKESLNIHFTNARFIFIIGVLKDKEYEKMTEILCPMAEACYIIKPQNARGLETDVLSEAVSPYCDDVTRCETVDEAVSMAVDKWREITDTYDEGYVDEMTAPYCEGYSDDVKEPESTNENEAQDTVIVAWGSLSYIGEVTL